MTDNENNSVAKVRCVGAILLLLYLVMINSMCTQYIAYALNFHKNLGGGISFGSSYLYAPFKWWYWLFDYYDVAINQFNYAFIFFSLGFLVGIVFYVLYVGFSTRSSRKHSDAHGTAHFASLDEVKESGLLPENGKPGRGVYCGAYDDPVSDVTHYLRHDGPEHVIAMAPTRSGKGVGLVIPTLLSWPHSVFVLDRKGENYAMTSGWRKKYAKNKILRFDPAKPNSGCSWNPLGEIQFKTRFQVSDTQNISLMVIDSDGKGIAGDHFRSAAFELLVGLILHALYKGETLSPKRTPCLQDIGHMLTGVGDFAAPDTANDLLDSPESDPKALVGLFNEMKNVSFTEKTSANNEAKLVINGVGTRMANTPARELGSIISTANNALALYRDPIVGENTRYNHFKISDLMDHESPVSLYLISTPKTSKRLVPLVRLLLTMIVLTLADEMEFDNGRAKTTHLHRLLLMLDEFPTLGKIDVFEEALAYIAGYGMKAYIIAQDVQQLYKAYSNYESIISNCHVRVAYAPNKVDTAEWMSKMTGVSTVVKEKITTSGNRFGMVLGSVSRSYDEQQRPLMTPDEIMRLPGPKKDPSGEKILKPGELLVFVAGQAVIKGRQILYFLDPVFSKRSKIKPVNTDIIRKDNTVDSAFSFDAKDKD